MSLVEEMADNIVFLLEGEIHFNGSPTELKKKYKGTSVERSIVNLLNGSNN